MIEGVEFALEERFLAHTLFAKMTAVTRSQTAHIFAEVKVKPDLTVVVGSKTKQQRFPYQPGS